MSRSHDVGEGVWLFQPDRPLMPRGFLLPGSSYRGKRLWYFFFLLNMALQTAECLGRGNGGGATSTQARAFLYSQPNGRDVYVYK